MRSSDESVWTRTVTPHRPLAFPFFANLAGLQFPNQLLARLVQLKTIILSPKRACAGFPVG
jgi:hypothetical protein